MGAAHYRHLRIIAPAAFAALLTGSGCADPLIYDPLCSTGAASGSFQPNACGPDGLLGFLVPECPLGLVCFTCGCELHDRCYFTCGRQRAECDDAFYDDLQTICFEQFHEGDPRRQRCLDLAYIYWQAVVRFGQPFFDFSQDRLCVEGDQSDASMERSARTVPRPPFEDADDDLLPDDWERAVGLDPTRVSDATEDIDGDGLNALQELLFGTDPCVP